MAIPYTDLLSEVQLALLEPDDAGATWPSGLWTATEVLAVANQRQRRLVRDTLLFTSHEPVVVPAGTRRPSLPADWIATVAVLWDDGSGSVKWLQRSSEFEANLGLPTWISTPGVPQVYSDSDPDTLEIELMPVPVADGTLQVFAVEQPAVLEDVGLGPELLTVPDELAPGLFYGILEDLLSKMGRSANPEIAAYCHQRWEETVELGRLMLAGVY
jgi:hypothetical protein